MNEQLDSKYVIQALVRQRDDALAKVVQLEAILAMQAEKASKPAPINEEFEDSGD